MKNSSMQGKQAAILIFSWLVLAATAGCPARSSSSEREPDILSAVGEDKDPPAADIKVTAKADGDRLGKHKPFDPIEINGTYFEDDGKPWPKPDVALLISGRQDGYLEPCGCAGIENQKGGLSRRYTLIQQLEALGWPLVSMDVGGQVRRFGKEAERQFSMSAEALKQMKYKAVGFGPEDLRLSSGDVAAAAGDGEGSNSVFVSANVSLFAKDSGLTPRFRIVKVGKWKFGITSVLGEEFQKKVNNTDVVFQPPREALKEVVPELKDCDVNILLAYTSLDEARDLAEFPAFKFVAVGTSDDPPDRPELIKVKVKVPNGTKEQTTRLIQVGHKSMFAAVVGLYSGNKKPSIRFQRVALDSRYKNSPAMTQLMREFQNSLELDGWKGLGVKAAAHPRGKFSGSESCKACHESAWDVWHESKHGKALETLMKLDPPRQFDAECVSCHVTGWNATDFFPYKGGYLSMQETPHLAHNGCENCHGPGASHVQAENGQDKALRAKLRAEMHLQPPTAKENNCIKCHDGDNSPEFKLDKYWQEIQH